MHGGLYMHLQESGEMYLESIYVLSKKSSNVRSIDVVEYMGFSKPSVSRAVSLLKKGGFLSVDNNGYLSLTEEGFRVAENIYNRHNILTEFLMKLGVDKKTASQDACKMEHDISNETLNAIKKFTKKEEL